jgi:ElaB/YqjD/DUF883 family membrane-anchored ribosome-binding protein
MTADIDERIRQAAAERIAARARLSETLTTIQHRLDPRVLAEQALDRVREQSHRLADDAADYVRERKPTIIAVAVAAVLWLFRRDLGTFARWAMDKATPTTANAEAEPTPSPLHASEENPS